MRDFVIDQMTESHWEQVRRIFIEGISTGHATFEAEAPSWERWNAGHLSTGRLVARAAETIKGWAALSPVSGRCVYAGVAETSVYVGQDYRGQGIGSALLEALLMASESNGVWTLQAGIFPENISSIRLHQRFGFREVGRRERIGKLHGKWRDTLLLERRSNVVGVD